MSKAGLISNAYEGYGDNSTGTRIANSKHFLTAYNAHKMASAANSVAAVPDASTPVSDAYASSDFGHRSHDVEEIHVHSHLDGKQVAHSVQKRIVKANRQVFGAGGHDRLGNHAGL